MKYSQVKKRVQILHANGLKKSVIGDWHGYVKHIKIDGIYGLMLLDKADVWDEDIRYFEEYIVNCVKYTEQATKKEFVKRSLYGGGDMDG